MKTHIFQRKNTIEIISVIEICLGLTLLIFKIRNIYAYNEFLGNMPEGLEELVSYEVMRYGDVLLGAVCVFAGSIYWLSKRIYWILTQIFLCLLLLKVELSLLWFYDIRLIPLIIYMLSICSIFLFIMSEIKLFKIKEIKSIPIDNKVKLSGIIVSFISCFIYGYFEGVYPFS